MDSKGSIVKKQHEAWESEYRNPRFLSLGASATAEAVRFAKWMKKRFRSEQAARIAAGELDAERQDFSDMLVLDLGCGTGRNLFYFIERDARGVGYDISPEAIRLAHERAQAAGYSKQQASFFVRNMGEAYTDLADASVDIIIDTTSSHALLDAEREVYLDECARVLKPGGKMLVRMLCKDGDANAKYLIENFPGPEKNTYILPGVNVFERAATLDDIEREYGSRFCTEEYEKTFHYAPFGYKSYKRAYWVLYLSMKPRSKSE